MENSNLAKPQKSAPFVKFGRNLVYSVKNLVLQGHPHISHAFNDQEDWYTFIFVIDDFDGQLIESPEGYLQWIPDD